MLVVLRPTGLLNNKYKKLGIIMDLQRLLKLAGVEAVVEAEVPVIKFSNGTPSNGFEPAEGENLLTQEFNTDTMEVNVAKQGIDTEQEEKVEVPSDVSKWITKRVAEIKASMEEYDDKGYNDTGAIYAGVKGNAIEALEKFKEHLAKGDSEGYKMAQVYYGTLMSPIQDMLPSQLVKFLHSKQDPKKTEI
jgi:hypothetical protein